MTYALSLCAIRAVFAQVVRQAVKDGTLHELAATLRRGSKAAASDAPPPRKRGRAAAAAVAAATAAPDGDSADSVVCALCVQPKSTADIAVTVAGEAFCTNCDHFRRRANNLGLQTREVTSAYRSGSLASFLGMSEAELAAQIGAAGQGGGGGAAAGLAEAPPRKPAAAAGGGGKFKDKAGTAGRLCRMCRQVRAPIVGALPCSASVTRLLVLYSCAVTSSTEHAR